MEKEKSELYDLWNCKKQSLEDDNAHEKIFFKTGEIWWCSLGLNVGNEALGKGPHFRRPVLILRKLSGNLGVVLPLTSKNKTGTWFIDITLHGQTKWVMLYQIRTLHKKRFQRKLGQLDDADFTRVKRKLETLLELSENHHPVETGIEGIDPKSK